MSIQTHSMFIEILVDQYYIIKNKLSDIFIIKFGHVISQLR